MNIKTTQVAPVVSEKYPYTHRLELDANESTYQEIYSWITDNEVKCCVIPYRQIGYRASTYAIYTDHPTAVMFTLRFT